MNFPSFSSIRIHVTYKTVNSNTSCQKTFHYFSTAEKFLKKFDSSSKISSLFVVKMEKTASKGQRGTIISFDKDIEPSDTLPFLEKAKAQSYKLIAQTKIPNSPTASPLHSNREGLTEDMSRLGSQSNQTFGESTFDSPFFRPTSLVPNSNNSTPPLLEPALTNSISRQGSQSNLGGWKTFPESNYGQIFSRSTSDDFELIGIRTENE